MRMLNSAIRLLDEAALAMPTQVALEDENSEYNYALYRDQALRIATSLLDIRSPRSRPVAVLLPKGCEAVIAFMGVLYTGSPYAPLDYDSSPQRIKLILDNLKPSHIITDRAWAQALDTDCSVHLYETLISGYIDQALVDNEVNRVIDTDPAYIIYSAAATDRPKGATISHRGALDYAGWMVDTFHLSFRTVVANQADFCFNTSVFDIYGMLLCRGRMVITPQALFRSPARLPAFLRDHEVTCILWTPTALIDVANCGALQDIRPMRLSTILFCGEVMPNAALNVWRRALPQRTFANLYGPAEVSSVCAYYIVDRAFKDSDPLPIGQACENTRILLLDDSDHAVAPGVQGEICVLGSGVGLGYWNQPQLSQQAFVQNPLNHCYQQPMYRTGDLGTITRDGLILFHGRKDCQIVLGGMCIGLEDIECAALCVEGVEHACALFDREKQEIILAIQTKENFPAQSLNQWVSQALHPELQLGQLHCLPALPRTASGKIDRESLQNMYTPSSKAAL